MRTKVPERYRIRPMASQPAVTLPQPNLSRRTKHAQTINKIPLPPSDIEFRPRKREYDARTILPEVLGMMARGYSKAEIMLSMGMFPTIWYKWEAAHPEFKEAVREGMELYRGWWERMGRINITNPVFNSTLFMMNMQNRFGWTRKFDTGGAPVNLGDTYNIQNNDNRKVEVKLDRSPNRRAKVLDILLRTGAVGALNPGKPGTDITVDA